MVEVKMYNEEGWDHRGYIGEKIHYYIVKNALCDKSIMYHPPYFDKNFIPEINDPEYSDYCIKCIRRLKIKTTHRDLKTYFTNEEEEKDIDWSHYFERYYGVL